MYIQINGGPENANTTLLGWLQLLVAKRIVPEILLTRLPVRHMHEDIDALFGHIWTSFRLNPCLTLSDYAEVVHRCFAGMFIWRMFIWRMFTLFLIIIHT